jgi:hypothetical protein
VEPDVRGQVQPGVGATRGRREAAHRRVVPHRKRGYPELLRPALLAEEHHVSKRACSEAPSMPRVGVVAADEAMVRSDPRLLKENP